MSSFAVDHFPFSTVEGRFNAFEGGLALPEEVAKSKQALFIIDVASVATGGDDLNDYIKSAAFFNAEKFPLITFVSTDFEWLNKSTARLIGNLTLHGITRPLIFNVVIDGSENKLSSQNEKVIMLANAEINRSDFGMHGLQLLVSDTVTFNLKIEAYRMPQLQLTKS
jgi:polyisoprenoid-binding protein YceI